KNTKRVKQEPVLINYKVDGSYHEKTPDENDLEKIKAIDGLGYDNWIPTDPIPDGDKMAEPKNRSINYVHQFYTKRNLIVLSRIYDKVKDHPALLFVFTSIAQTLTSKLVRYNLGNRGNGPLNGTLYISSL